MSGINLQQFNMNSQSPSSSVDPTPLLVEDHGRILNHRVVNRSKESSSSSSSSSSSDIAGDALLLVDAPPPPPPPETSSKWRRPHVHAWAYLSDLSVHFPPKFLSWLAMNNCFITGGAYTLVMAMSLPLFKGLGIGASRQQLYVSMIGAPWAMKPFIGVASDLFPIMGYNKRYFALFAILVGLAGCSTLLGLSTSTEGAMGGGPDAVQMLTDWIVLCFTAVSYEAATLDILGEGKYAELMHLHPESGSSIISFKFGMNLLGSIVVQSFVGPLSDMGYFHVLFWISLSFSLIPLLPTLMGWIPEKKVTSEDAGMMSLWGRWLLFDIGSFREKMAPFVVITLCGLAAPLLAAVTTYASLRNGLIFAAVLIVAFCAATYSIFPRSFFWIFLSIILTQMSYISIGSALGYYYTASETCVPNGPNFNYTYYITVTGIVGSIMNLFSVVLYQNVFSGWRFRSAIILTLVIGGLASMVDLVIIMRWNIDIGIPDKVFFMFGNTIFGNIIYTLQSIPFSAIYAKICPPGMESAVFSYTVGISNFCGIVTSLIGSGVIHWSGMKTVGEDCNFDALPLLVVVFQILAPIVIGIPAMFLIPNALQTERLIDWAKEGWYSPEGTDESARTGLLVSGEDDDCVEDERSDPQLGILL
ncbi:hypothetical protein ACHAXA_010362 [Cyclostephanos tholiformis]|uniref:Uncharacterized protein n=1 Tax=Cyclostephanos tholiformis TaxID=382380 RepID=A0ABD3RV20_9STRA